MKPAILVPVILGKRIPRGTGFLAHIPAPNSGSDWMLPATTACYDATGGSALFYSNSTPTAIAATSAAIIADGIGSDLYGWNVIFSTANGLTVYDITTPLETINKARRYHGYSPIYPALAWGVGYQSGLQSLYGPQPAFASAGWTPDGLGGLVPGNVLPLDGCSVVTNANSGGTPFTGPGYTNMIPGAMVSFFRATYSNGSLFPTIENSTHIGYTASSSYTVAGTVYCFSFKAKYNGCRYIKAVQDAKYCNFDLVSGVYVAASGVEASIENVGDEWFLCKMRFTQVSTSRPYVALSPNNTAHWDDSYVGVVTEGVYIDVATWQVTPNYFYPPIAPGTTASSATYYYVGDPGAGKGVYVGPGYSNIAPTTLTKDAACTLTDGWYDFSACTDGAESVWASYSGALATDELKPFAGYWLAEFETADIGKKVKYYIRRRLGGTYVGTNGEHTITAGVNTFSSLTFTGGAGAYGAVLIILKENDAGYATKIKPTGWFIVQSAYTFPYIPPGTTVVSTAGTSGNNGLGWAMDSKMLESLRGRTDGVELVTNAADREFSSNTGWWSRDASWSITGGKGVVTSGVVPNALYRAGAVIGQRYLITFTVDSISGGSIAPFANGANGQTISTPGTYSYETVGAGSNSFGVRVASGTVTATIDNISIQRLLPSRCTVAALVTMGVGSGDTSATNQPLVAVKNGLSDALYYSPSETFIIKSFDGYWGITQTGTWSRNETHLKIVQTNRLGTQFRVGNRRLGIDSAIQWSMWATYDGSFNPLTVLRAAYNGTVPLHLKSIEAWDRPIADAEIYRWATEVLV